jgi:hypothetical protein
MSIYTRIYNNLVSSHRSLKEEWKPIGSGLERHRIIPRHQGGTYEESNCTYLTHHQHIIAHWLLWKINGHEEDLMAWRYMSEIKVCSMLGKFHSIETKVKMSKASKGKKKAEQHCLNIGKSAKGRIPPNKGKSGTFKHSKETKRKIAESTSKRMKGKIPSDEHRRNMSIAAKNRKRKPLSEETKRKIAESLKGKKHIIKRKWKNNN